MRRIILLVVSIGLGLGQGQPESPVGRWRSTDVSSNGIRTVLEFSADNQLVSYSSVISEEKYRLIGTDTIAFQAEGSPEEKLELEWNSHDHAHIDREPAGTLVDLVRIGKAPDSKNPILGAWNTTREWNASRYPARAIFSADGKVAWITDIRSDRGHYSVQDQTIRLEIADRPVVEGTFKLEGSQLTLPNPRGGQSIFERF